MGYWTLLTLLSISILAVFGEASTDSPPPVNLNDRVDISSWESCSAGESCLSRRKHACANSEKPHVSCGKLVWKEEMIGCYTCSDDVWTHHGDWSKCVGNGCGDTVQHFVRMCANRAVNPNCKLIQTRFCQPKEICNGTWSSWTSSDPECKDQCGTTRYRVIQRECVKNGEPSQSCEGGSNQVKMVDNFIDHCTDTPCLSTVSTTTAQPKVVLSPWGEWGGCTATCEKKEGAEARSRKCVYDGTKKDAPGKCGGEKMTEKRKCSLPNTSKCKVEKSIVKIAKSSTTTIATTSTTEDKLDENAGSGVKERIVGLPDEVTKSEEVTTAVTNVGSGRNLRKYEYKVLVIILATTACLILIVIGVYVLCSKKRKKPKIKDISVVGLQSHTGFMRGMEAYGFPKSMLPGEGDILTALNPASNDLGADVDTYNPPRRQLPDVPNDNFPYKKNHIYEEMRTSNDERQFSSCEIRPMRRSASYHERKRASTLMSDAELRSARRQSCMTLQHSVTPRRPAPVKPPRKSLMLLDSRDAHGEREIREVPRLLYESEQKSPDLGFINSIHPPQSSPPVERKFSTYNRTIDSLDLPMRYNIQTSRSAPVSPNHNQMGGPMQQAPFFPMPHYPNSLLVPYGGIPFMAPVQNQNGGVVYMPVSPIYGQAPPTSQATPLHGAEVTMRNKAYSASARRPKTTDFLPQISISVADKTHLSPQPVARSPILEDYAEMRQLRSPSIPPDFDDAGSNVVRSKSFRQLHGTHNKSPSRDNFNDDGDDDQEKFPEEDGYLLPRSPRESVRV